MCLLEVKPWWGEPNNVLCTLSGTCEIVARYSQAHTTLCVVGLRIHPVLQSK